MASLFDSVRNISGDSFPYVKIGIISLAIFYLPELYKNQQLSISMRYSLLGLIFLLILGFMARMAHNTLKENEILMPGFLNIFILLWDGIKAVIALFPMMAAIYYIMTEVFKLISFTSVVNNIILFMVIMVMIALFSLALILYSRRLNIIDAYKVMDILNYSGDFIAYSFTLIFFVGLFVGVICVPIGAAIHMLFEHGPVFNFYVTFVCVFLLISIIQYYAQIYTEFLKAD